jgi:hypothetical protein
MRGKSLRTCVLVLGLLLGASSSAYADAISITSVSLSNVQLVPTSGTIVFFLPQFSPGTRAFARATNSLGEESVQASESLTTSQATANVTFASASALSNFTNFSFSANSNVMLSGCNCSAFSVGQTFLLESFMITGGSGTVTLNVSALLQTMQTVMTDQFGLLAESNIFVGLSVSNADHFSFDSSLRIGPNSSMDRETEEQLSRALTLEFGKEYSLFLTLGGNSIAENQAEIPEPATAVLLVSGLGFMAGSVRRKLS